MRKRFWRTNDTDELLVIIRRFFQYYLVNWWKAELNRWHAVACCAFSALPLSPSATARPSVIKLDKFTIPKSTSCGVAENWE